MSRKRTTSRSQLLRNAAKLQMMASGEIFCRNDTRPIPGTLKELYNELNDELFDGQLPDIPVYYNDTLRRSLGRASCSSDGKAGRGKRKGCRATAIEIRGGFPFTPRFLRKVMAHEMCHVWSFEEYGEVGHGPQFWKKMRGVGYTDGHRFPGQQRNETDIYCL